MKANYGAFFFFILPVLLPAFLFAQEPVDPPAKFALVIGNGSYTGSLSKLANPENDANDISRSLEELGFTVEKILNGDQITMETAVTRLKERLSVKENSYGFFFYAGHAVQSSGENYLIPVDADIPSENYLRNRAVSVQVLLDELNDAGNNLNIIVLDACRDNPFGWRRSGSRGLTLVSSQPADSIIVYATSAGSTAADGEGRNGLFTSQLLKNIKTPGIDVVELFRRTGSDVAQVSERQQVPAIYNQFFGKAYLGEIPTIDSQGNIIVQGETIFIKGKKEMEPAKLWSIGASAGSSIVTPLLIGILRGTIAPFNYSFLELGIEAGFFSEVSDVDYYSFYPYVHINYFRPITEKIGLYAGAGAGYLSAKLGYPTGDVSVNRFAMDIVAGLTLFDMIDISYTFRSDFKRGSNKISAGYFYRFK